MAGGPQHSTHPSYSPSDSTDSSRASMGTGASPMQAEGNHGHALFSLPISHHSTEGIPGEPGVAVQSEPPSVGQREAPGEETEKGLREARREGAKGKNALEGSQVGQRIAPVFRQGAGTGRPQSPTAVGGLGCV